MSGDIEQQAPRTHPLLKWNILLPIAMGLTIAASPIFAHFGSLTSWTYDTGVYFGASVRLVHGVLPYRDFVLLHPPGLALLLSPISLLSYAFGTSAAIAMARIVVIMIMGLNAGLAASLLRFRGTGPSFVAGLFLAFYPAGAANASKISLEPFLMCFCMLSFAFAFQRGRLVLGRRAWLAGLAMGVAATMKIWAFFPFLVVVVAYLIVSRRDSARFVAGTILGFIVPCCAFIIASPVNFVRDVVFTQLARSASTVPEPGAGYRIPDIIWRVLGPIAHSPGDAIGVFVVIVILMVPIVVFGVRFITPFDVAVFSALALAVAALLVSNIFYIYYIYFVEVFAAMAVGILFGLLGDIFFYERATPWRPSTAIKTTFVVLVVVGGVLFVNVGWKFTKENAVVTGATVPSGLISALIPQGACVVTNDVFYLLSADRFSPSRSGCPAVLDPYGVWLEEDPKYPSPSPAKLASKVTATWHTTFSNATYVLIAPGLNYLIPWNQNLERWFHSHFVLVGRAHYLELFLNKSA